MIKSSLKFNRKEDVLLHPQGLRPNPHHPRRETLGGACDGGTGRFRPVAGRHCGTGRGGCGGAIRCACGPGRFGDRRVLAGLRPCLGRDDRSWPARLEGPLILSPLTIWSAIALFSAAGLAVALRAARENRGTAEDWYLAGRGLGGLVAGLSYAATTYSAFMLVVLTGLTYRGGIDFGHELRDELDAMNAW